MESIEPKYKLSTILQFLESEYGEQLSAERAERAKIIIGRLNTLEGV